jgi:hypothetical protein
MRPKAPCGRMYSGARGASGRAVLKALTFVKAVMETLTPNLTVRHARAAR